MSCSLIRRSGPASGLGSGDTGWATPPDRMTVPFCCVLRGGGQQDKRGAWGRVMRNEPQDGMGQHSAEFEKGCIVKTAASCPALCACGAKRGPLCVMLPRPIAPRLVASWLCSPCPLLFSCVPLVSPFPLYSDPAQPLSRARCAVMPVERFACKQRRYATQTIKDCVQQQQQQPSPVTAGPSRP